MMANNFQPMSADEAVASMLGQRKVSAPQSPDQLAQSASAAVDDYLGKNPMPENTQTTFAQAAGGDADYVAELRKVSAKTGVPVDSVRANPADAKRKAQIIDADIPQLAQKYPATNKLLADPQDAAVSHDDVDGLTGVEKALQVAKTTVRSMGRWPADIASAGYAIAETAAKGTAPAFDWTAGTLLPENPLRRLAFEMEQARKSTAEVGNQIQGPLPKDAGFLERNLYNAGTSLGLQIPAIGASLATANPWTGLALMGITQGGQSAADTLDKGGSPYTAMVRGLADAGSEIGTEYLPAVGLLKNIKAKSGVGKILLDLVKKEIPGEITATEAQNATEWLLTNPDKSLADFAAEQPKAVADTAMTTLLQTMMTAGIGGGITATARRMERAQSSQANADTIKAVAQAAAASKLAQRDTETFQKFVDSATEDGPLTDVYIDAGALMQSGVADQVAQLSPSVAEQLPVAAETGGTIRIPVGEFAAKLATSEHADALMDHLRVAPDEMSNAEVRDFQQNAAEELDREMQRAAGIEEGDKPFKEGAKQVADLIGQQLEQTGRFGADANNAYATMMGNWFAVQGARLGMSPVDLFHQTGLNIASATGQGGRQLSQAPVTQLHGAEIAPANADLPTLRKAAKTFFTNNLAGRVINNASLGAISLTKRGMNKALSTSANPMKLRLMAALPELLANGEVVRTQENAFPETHQNIKRYHWLRGTVDLNGEPVTVEVNVEEHADGKMYYNHTLPGREYFQNEGAQNQGPSIPGGLVHHGAPEHDGSAPFRSIGPDSSAQSVAAESGSHNMQVISQEARGAFNPDTNTITLLKSADLSTFLHESGHFFLEQQLAFASKMMALADSGTELTAQQQELVDDAHKLLAWFGVKDLDTWYSMSLDEQRASHEKFARGFEAYLFSGKAPNVDMQPIFQRFSAWLKRIYKQLTALNVKLTPEVSGVMDRMLATTEQIAMAEQARGMVSLFETAEQAGMSPEAWAEYQRRDVDASADAAEDFQARAMRDMQYIQNARGREIKRLQKEAKAVREGVRMEVRGKVMSQPVYRAWQFLTGKAASKSAEQIAHATALEEWKARRAEFEAKTREDLKAKLLAAHPEAKGIERGQIIAKNKKQMGIDIQQALLDWDKQNAKPVAPAAPATGETAGRFEFGRIDLGALKEMTLPEGVLAAIKARRMTAVEGGLHPDVIAEAFGYSSGDEMVRALAEATPPKEEIEAITDQVMMERHGELATPEAIEMAAELAIHNDVRARLMATEYNALAKRTGQRKLLLPAAKAMASAVIGRLKVRDIRPATYTGAEARAGRNAEKAFRKGDTAQAASEKRNQILNFHLAKAAFAAQDEVAKGVRYLQKFAKDGVRKNLDVDYLDQIDALLDRFDLRTGQSLKAIDKRTSLLKWVESQREQGLEPDIPEALLNEANRQSYKDMPLDDFRALVDSVRTIEHMGRLKNKLLTAKDQREFNEVVDELKASIDENSRGRVADTRTPTTNLGRTVDQLKIFWTSHIKVATLARVFDGGKDGGSFWERIIRPANERADFEATRRAQATEALSEILSPVFKLGKMGGKGIHIPEVGRPFNREMRLAIALNIGNASNLQRLMGGENWTQDQVMAILKHLTRDEWNAVQSVWDHFESYRPEIGAKERRIYGKEPEWVEPGSPLLDAVNSTMLMNLKGGYYPVKYDPRASQRAEQHSEAEDAKRQLQGAYTSATTRRSFTKARAEEVIGRPLLYSLSGIYSGVNDVIHDLAWHEYLIDINRIMKTQRFDSAIRNQYGPHYINQIKTWVQDIAGGDARVSTAGDQMLGFVRRSVSVSGLGFNVVSAIMQPLGLTQSIVRVGAGWIAHGVRDYIRSPLEATRRVNAMSEFMRNRNRTRFRELNELRNRVQDQGPVKGFLQNNAYSLMMLFQSTVDVPTWLGAYAKATAEGHADDKAVALADQAVIDSQGGGETKDQAWIERSGNNFVKIFTVFYSFMNTALNIGIAQGMTRTSATKFAADMLLLYTVPAVLGQALKDAITPGGGDDDEDWLGFVRKMLGAQIDYLFGLFVVGREFGSAAKTLTGTSEFGPQSYPGPAGTRMIADVYKAAGQVSQGDLDLPAIKAMINLSGDLLGLPAAQINRTLTGAVALGEGDTNNPAALVMGYQK